MSLVVPRILLDLDATDLAAVESLVRLMNEIRDTPHTIEVRSLPDARYPWQINKLARIQVHGQQGRYRPARTSV